MAKRRIYKIYFFGMYSKFRVFSKVLDTNKERLESRKEEYLSRGYECGNIAEYPFKTSEKDFWDIITF